MRADEQFSNIEAELRERGVYVSTTAGVSMKPMLRNRRDRIVLLPIGDKTLKKWDLPIYRRPDGRYILHRIIDVKDDHYVIRGDNTYVKEYVPKEWILGYVSEFYRGKRHVSTDDRGYRRYAAFWHGIYFLRVPFHKARRLASKIKHKLFK
ncbi:MAG: hypothetical protein IJW29_07475 [Clostridia bacterium]|nr:hypothetical protein [Clostridia bacterium]